MQKLLLSLFLLLPIAAFADEVKIAAGMDKNEAIKLIKQHGGTDITPNIEVVPPRGEWPLKEIYWSLADYDVVIELHVVEGKVKDMLFWRTKDFDESKSHRAKTEQKISVLKLDTANKKASVEKAKEK